MEHNTRNLPTRAVSPSRTDPSQELSCTRSDGPAAVAHDLRTPLSVIQFTAARLLQETSSDLETVRHGLETILRSVAHATRLTEHLLEESADGQKNIPIESAPVHVPLVLDSVKGISDMLTAQTSVGITIEADRDLPFLVADVESISRVLENLIANAAKFTPSGGRIVVRAYAIEGEVRFSVSDTGPGIEAGDQVHIFEPFWRAPSTDGRSHGLGLSICRQIVEAHGGRIWHQSRPGSGAEFVFALPAVRQDQATRDADAR